jgi:hypothetical protein
MAKPDFRRAVELVRKSEDHPADAKKFEEQAKNEAREQLNAAHPEVPELQNPHVRKACLKQQRDDLSKVAGPVLEQVRTELRLQQAELADAINKAPWDLLHKPPPACPHTA